MDEHGWIVCVSCGASLPHSNFPNLNKPDHPDAFTCRNCLKGIRIPTPAQKRSIWSRITEFLWN